MLCPAADTGMFWKIKPTPTACANFTADPPFPTTHRFKIYRPNIDLLAIRAAHCSRIQETIKYKTDLVDNPHSYYSFLNLTTSKEECLRMWTFGQCQNGQLTGEARSRRTHNGQEPQFTYWQIGYKTASATDCFLTELDIYIKPGASKMSTPFSDLSHCHYRDEFCILLDGSILAWKREERDEVKLCNFIQFADWAGTFMGNIWIANNSEFALSFAETPPSVEDCKRQLSLSEQGYAVPRNQYRLLMAKKGRRSRRSADVGRVFTNQLGAQLTASQVLATEAMRKILNHLTALICAQRSRFGFGQRMFSGTEAITFARTVMNTTYVTARWISNEFLEIKHCVPIPRRNVTFLPSQKCYRDIPVNVTVLHRGMGAFLDPRTLIVEEKSIEKSCEYNQYATIYIEGQLIKINQKTGKTRVIGPEEIHELAVGDEALAFRNTDLKPHAFGNFLITNYSDPRIEVLQILQAFRLDNRFEQERLAKQIGRMGENRHINENQFDRILPKPPQWLQTLWEYKLADLLNLICWLYVLLRIFGDWVLPVLIRYALFNMPFERQAAQRLREAAFRLRANNELIELPPGAEGLQAGRRRRRYRRPRNVT
uniref:Rhodanese domain-containing protein n=1 Tax=Globodera pallida TaxID=36090 RepID=A0A183C5R9_GLOPA